MGNLWFFCALGSAAIWGFGYSLTERILKNDLSVISYMTVTGFVYFVSALTLCIVTGHFRTGMTTLMMDREVLFYSLLTSLCYVIGSLLIYFAISLKNASLANIIEITYPLFTLLFAYLLFKDVQMNVWGMAGALLIVCGTALILVKA